MKTIYQCQNKGCGYACVKMLLSKRDKNRNWAYADEPEAEKTAPTLEEIEDYGKAHGLVLRSYRVGKPYDWRFLASKNAIVLLEEDGRSHSCVLTKATKTHVKFLDPTRGVRRMKIQELEGLFSGIVLVAGLDKKLPGNAPKRGKGVCKLGWISTSLSFVSVFLIGIGFLLSERASKWIAFSFYLVGLLSLGLFLISSRYLQSVFDKKYQHGLLKEDADLRKELFTHYYTYKTTIFGAIPRVSCEFGILCSVLFYCSFSNPWQGLILGILGVTLLLSLHVIQERSHQIAKEVETEENNFLKEGCGKEELIIRQKSYQNKGFQYSKIWLLKILVLFSFALLSTLCCVLSSHNDAKNSWFEHLMLCLLFSVQILDLASYLPAIFNVKKETSYFWFHFVRKGGK